MTPAAQQDVLQKWQQKYPGATQRIWRLPSDLGFFFQKFRPNGDGLNALFSGIELGEEIMPRLQEIYEVCAPGHTPSDTYFTVRKPRLLTEQRLKDVTRIHLRKMGQIGKIVDAPEVGQFLASEPLIEVLHAPPTPRAECNDIENKIYDACAAFMDAMDPMESTAQLLGDALSNMADEPFIRYHVLWPLYLHCTDVVEPYEPFMELWRHAAELRIENAQHVVVVVADTAEPAQ